MKIAALDNTVENVFSNAFILADSKSIITLDGCASGNKIFVVYLEVTSIIEVNYH